MNRILVWDLPARILHWAFALSLSATMAIGFLVDDDSPRFKFHMLLGIVSLFLVAIRLIMGLAGSRYAKFSSYPLHPVETFKYFSSAIFAKTKRYAGNNPGSALAAASMFLLVPCLFATGIGFGGGPLEDIHESLAWALLAVVGLHLAGLIWHTIRHRENIALSMVDGRKLGEPEAAIPSAHRWAGAAVVIATAAWAAALFANYEPQSASVKLPVIGVTLRLGGNEHGGSNDGQSRKQESNEDKEDD